jgi:hypothetical protein
VRAVVVAVTVVLVVQVALDDVVDVIAVLHRFVPAVGPVHVVRVVVLAIVTFGALVRVRVADGDVRGHQLAPFASA